MARKGRKTDSAYPDGMASEPLPHPNAWASLRRTITRFETAKIQPSIGFRNAIGISIPLAFGVALGAAPSGLTAATGALNVSFTDGSDPYRLRVQRMLAATALTSFAVIFGTLCGRHPVLALLAPIAWAAGAGLLIALDQAAADIGVISLVTLVVFVGQPMDVHQAFYAGCLAMLGGLLQTTLAIALWPVRRYEVERQVLATLFRELAKAAGSGAPATEAPPASAEATRAQLVLAGLWRSRNVQGERYRSLLNQAERIRLGLMMLARLRTRLGRDPETAAKAAALDEAFRSAAEVLISVAGSLSAGATQPASFPSFDRVTEQLEPTGSAAAMIADACHAVNALAGQLRASVELSASSTVIGREAFERREARKPWWLRLMGTVAILRANIDPRSVAFQHAIRLSLCIAAGELIARLLRLERAYWIPMTIAIVLKPDFTSTYARGLLRLGGTFVGLLLATILFELAPPGPWLDVLLIGTCAFVIRAFGPANYGIFVVAVSAMVVLAFATIGVAPSTVVADRGSNTVIGGLLALAAYAVWPTWERSQVGGTMAALLDAYRSYFRPVREGYLHPDRDYTRELEKARGEARLARSNLEASVDRLANEPGSTPESLGRMGAILASSHRLIHAMMSLEAGLSGSRPVQPRPEFARFSNAVEVTLHSLAAALRGARLAPAELPDLRAHHHALVHSGDPTTERYALVNVETDRITNSLNTLAEQVLDWLPQLFPSQREAQSRPMAEGEVR